MSNLITWKGESNSKSGRCKGVVGSEDVKSLKFKSPNELDR